MKTNAHLYKINSNVGSLLPSQWTDYEEVKKILRKYKFKINDKTNKLTYPKTKVALTLDDIEFLDGEFMILWNFREREAEFRLK